MPYQTPGEPGPIGEHQRVYDRVAGPNLRLHDNLIQLLCVVVGGVAGAVVGNQFHGPGGLVGGLVAGLVGALILSGLVIGIIRWVGAKRK